MLSIPLGYATLPVAVPHPTQPTSDRATSVIELILILSAPSVFAGVALEGEPGLRGPLPF